MYNVVLRKNAFSKIIWAVFSDEDSFNHWCEKDINLKNNIIEKGVTEERAIELCSSEKKDNQT
jgi:hypothetical protein